MHFDFIEIGTSDFDTLAQSTTLCGISVEPLKFYLDVLPVRPGLIKVHAAVSASPGHLDCFYVDPDDIARHGLPKWLRGCNSVGAPHPTVTRELRERGLDSLVRSVSVRTLTWAQLVEEFGVTSVDAVKIDTEGHDCTVLNSMLDAVPPVLPKRIKFETNVLTPENDLQLVLRRLDERGYRVVGREQYNTVVERARRGPRVLVVGVDPLFSTEHEAFRFALLSSRELDLPVVCAVLDSAPRPPRWVGGVFVFHPRVPNSDAAIQVEMHEVLGCQGRADEILYVGRLHLLQAQ